MSNLPSACHELMTARPFTVGPETSVFETLQLMANEDIRHVPVVQNGALVGLISDRDLRHVSWSSIAAGSVDRLRVAVSELMTGQPFSVGPESSADEVVELMIEHKVGAIPVVDESTGTLVGIISYIDILRTL